jgi:amino acid adenylation domain-containing protein
MNTENTIHRLFEVQVEKTPGQTAIIDGNESITYQVLNEQSNQLAHYLRFIGVKPDDKVAVCLNRSIDLLTTILGILKAGAAYVPLDMDHPPERFLFCLEDNNNPILISTAAVNAKFTAYQGKWLILNNEKKFLRTQPLTNPDTLIQPHNLAYVIYTSGTTGKPKGVLIEHASVVNYFHWFIDYCQCKPGAFMDFSANFIFDMAISVSVIPLMQGLTVVIGQDDIKKTASSYLKYLTDYSINIVKMTPSYLKLLLHEVKNNPPLLPHLNTIIIGGENLCRSECGEWLNIYPHQCIFNEYGPTEATVAATQFKVCKETIKNLGINVPIGKPGRNMNCYVLDQDNHPVPIGTHGELYISGLGLARGYLNQKALTEKQFIHVAFCQERLYKTGDICAQLEDGNFEYFGRMDSQIKIRGFRIEIQEIEQRLCSHPSIEDALIIVKEEGSEKKLIAYYIIKKLAIKASQSEIRSYLADHLPEYMLPTAFIQLENFPLAASGKVDKKLLPQPFLNSNHCYEAPTSSIEKKLATIWSRELQIPTVGLLDNFFDLGGNSLAAARIISDVQHILGRNLKLTEFYQSDNLRDLATRIEKTEKISNQKNIITDSSKKKFIPLGSFQFMLWLTKLFEPKAHKLNIVTRKRLQGRIDTQKLGLAFDALFGKHEIFCYRIFKFWPAQEVQKKMHFKFSEHNLRNLSEHDVELKLIESTQELLDYKAWKSNKPLLKVRLFYMPKQQIELQFCLPHIITDDVSPEILVKDLSHYYLLLQNAKEPIVKTDEYFKEYIYSELSSSNSQLHSHIDFWEQYLKDASLFAFPQELVIRDKQQVRELTYSTYVEMPAHKLNLFQDYCSQHHISLNHGLCAALVLALKNCCPNREENQSIVLNQVKSTRDNSRYDHTIGCFLGIDPLKININSKATLLGLSRQIHHSAIETHFYQRCSNLLKLGCISNFRYSKTIINQLLDMLINMGHYVVPRGKLNGRLLKIYQRLISFQRDRHFLININLQSNFNRKDLEKKNEGVFGLKTKKINIYQYDLLKVNSVLDVCFIQENYISYMVISANLLPQFREQLGMEMLRIIEEHSHQLVQYKEMY